ncbi:MAG: response regulator transcription factor, partial [Chitinophagaceae bacterium]|nr:response regulator transcription factor [Chitinophagaceae bacterium]
MSSTSGTPSHGLRVLVADDHPLVAEAFMVMFQQHFQAEKVHLASSADMVLEIMKEHEIDLLLLDLMLEEGISTAVLDTVKRRWPQTKVLVSSALPEENFGKRLIDEGADGFYSKRQNRQELQEAVKTVLSGKKYLSNNLLYKLVFNKKMSAENPFDSLSTREFEIVLNLLAGKPVNEIAEQLNLQRSTVSTHKARAMEKLGVSSNDQLQQLAAAHKI